MTTIFHPDHPHFQVHKAFVEGSFANPDCPPVVEYLSLIDAIWVKALSPGWLDKYQYRIKPRTITRTLTYPEPLREAPAYGTKVWSVFPDGSGPYCDYWYGVGYLLIVLKNGMVFATEADAQACYDALFGEQK